MALLIKPRHHAIFRHILQASFRLRREVFVDRLGWSLPEARLAAETGMEIDQFDHGAATYLVKLDPDGRIEATVRITPSLEPNVSCDVLGPAMGIDIPRAPHIVEMSRMCADPELSKEDRRAAMLDMRICISTLCLRNGWSHGVGVGYDHHIQPYVRNGLTIQILGPPVIFPGDREPCFAIMTSDPNRVERMAELLGGRPNCLQDPDEDPSLIARYGQRAVA